MAAARGLPPVETQLNKDCEITESSVLAIFKECDRDGNGVLDAKEFMGLMKALDPTLTQAEIDLMKKEADTNSDGDVCIPEFVKWVFNGGFYGNCKGAKHVRDVVHRSVHPDGNLDVHGFKDSELEMHWNQANKIFVGLDDTVKLGTEATDSYLSEKQMGKFLVKLTQEEALYEEFIAMWHDGEFPFAKGPGVKAAKEKRAARSEFGGDEDDELLDKGGFEYVMNMLDS